MLRHDLHSTHFDFTSHLHFSGFSGAMWLHCRGHLHFGVVPGSGVFPLALRGTLCQNLRLLPVPQKRQKAAPRHWLLVDGQAASLALLAHRNGCDPSHLWVMAYTYKLGCTEKWDLGMDETAPKTHQRRFADDWYGQVWMSND